jgi:antitoxin (DNA-binding transcriptional repressor) of toxin-antitoxin stability system
MSTITVEEIKREGLSWLQRVVAGETLVVIQAGQPVAEIKPVGVAAVDSAKLRPVGLCAGEFTVPDDFEEPLPEDLLDAFEGK